MLGVIELEMGLGNEDYEALGAFRYAMRKFLRFSKDFLADSKLTPEQYEALLAIKADSQHDKINIGDLSERLQVKHHTAVSLIDKLAARNFVARARSKEDRRHVYVELTQRGDAVLTKLASIHRREMRRRSSEMITALRRLQK